MLSYEPRKILATLKTISSDGRTLWWHHCSNRRKQKQTLGKTDQKSFGKKLGENKSKWKKCIIFQGDQPYQSNFIGVGESFKFAKSPSPGFSRYYTFSFVISLAYFKTKGLLGENPLLRFTQFILIIPFFASQIPTFCTMELPVLTFLPFFLPSNFDFLYTFSFASFLFFVFFISFQSFTFPKIINFYH